MFLGFPDPDPLVRGMDPNPAPDPDPSIILLSFNKNSKKGLDSYSLGLLSLKNDVNVPSEVWIRGSGSTPKCHGSGTLIATSHRHIFIHYLQRL
jgi:hypothetical protein